MASKRPTLHQGTLLLQFSKSNKSQSPRRCKMLSADSPLYLYVKDLRQRILLYVNPEGGDDQCHRMDVQIELTQDQHNLDSVTKRIQGLGVDVSSLDNYDFMGNNSFVLTVPSLQGRAEVAQPHITIVFKRGLLEHFAGNNDLEDQKRIALCTLRHIVKKVLKEHNFAAR